MNYIKPFLKWAGNKYRCLHHILSSFPPGKRLIEPFSGSAAIFMNTDYQQNLLAEENNDLVVLFQILQKEGESFIDYCRIFFNPHNNCELQYYDLREQFNHCVEPRQRAALFLYLNRHGYNGLCRYNQKGIYNVPFGRYKNPYFPQKEMYYFSQKSSRATFIKSDFRQTFSEAQTGDIIYCDPPYAPLNQSTNFSAYTGNKFGTKEQIILTELAKNAANRGATVLISNHDTDFTRHQYGQSQIISFRVRRSISCQPENRAVVEEILAIFRP